MSKHILLLQGSSRSDGNSAALAEIFIHGAEETNHTVYQPQLTQMRISGCRSCDNCRRENGFCIIHDDMYQIYEQFEKAEALVIISPVYFFAWPAHIKEVIDRLYCYGPNWPKREMAILMTSFDTDPTVFSPVVDHYRHFVNYLGWVDRGVLLAGSLSHKGDIMMHPMYQQAYELGKGF